MWGETNQERRAALEFRIRDIFQIILLTYDQHPTAPF